MDETGISNCLVLPVQQASRHPDVIGGTFLSVHAAVLLRQGLRGIKELATGTVQHTTIQPLYILMLRS